MKRNCSLIILIILLLTLTYTFSSSTPTESFVPSIKIGKNRIRRQARHILRDGFTQMQSFFS